MEFIYNGFVDLSSSIIHDNTILIKFLFKLLIWF